MILYRISSTCNADMYDCNPYNSNYLLFSADHFKASLKLEKSKANDSFNLIRKVPNDNNSGIIDIPENY